jgi:hypothetical protein
VAKERAHRIDIRTAGRGVAPARSHASAERPPNSVRVKCESCKRRQHQQHTLSQKATCRLRSSAPRAALLPQQGPCSSGERPPPASPPSAQRPAPAPRAPRGPPEARGKRGPTSNKEQGAGSPCTRLLASPEVPLRTSCAIRGARGGGIGHRSPPGSSEDLGWALGWVWSGGSNLAPGPLGSGFGGR